MTEERLRELLINCIDYIKYDNDSTPEHLHEICGFNDDELTDLGFDYLTQNEKTDKSLILKHINTNDSKGVYYRISKCKDAEYLLTHLSAKELDFIENILEAYQSGEFELVIPRNETGEIDFDGEWNTESPNHFHETTEAEIAVLKWLEGFEDTGYMMDALRNEVYKEIKAKAKEAIDIGEMPVTDFIAELCDMCQCKDKTPVLEWVRYAAFLYEIDDTQSTTIEGEMHDIYLALCYVRDNFMPEVLEKCIANQCLAHEIVNAAMLYHMGMTSNEVNDIMGENALTKGYMPKAFNEKGSLSVIKIIGNDDSIFLAENLTSDSILDSVYRAGIVHLLSHMSIEKILMQPALCGITVKEITDSRLMKAIKATCTDSTAISTITVYDTNTENVTQRKTEEMTKEEVDAFMHSPLVKQCDMSDNTIDMGGM